MKNERIAILELAQNRGHHIIETLYRCGVPRSKLDVIHLHEGQAPRQSYVAVISSGGPGSVRENKSTSDSACGIAIATAIFRKWLSEEIPILGICLSHQLLGQLMGGHVSKSACGTVLGFEEIRVVEPDDIFHGIPEKFILAQHHHDEVKVLPHGWCVLANSESCGIEVMRCVGHPVWTLQGHPELSFEFVRNGMLKGRIPTCGLLPRPGSDYEKNRLKLFSNFLDVVAF
ncbi:MAG: type 1 glutamine amidotransferase [Promethearchaeota archaeon]